MGVSNLVAAASGLTSAIKSLQTGSASTAGTVTITSVNTAKAVVMSFPTGAAGTVSVSGGMNGLNIGLNAANGGTYSLAQFGYDPSNQATRWPDFRAAQAVPTPTAGINYFQGLNAGTNGINGTVPGWIVGQMSNNTGSYQPLAVAQTGLYYPLNVNAANGSTSGGNFNSGSNNLYAASYGAYLTNGTTLTVTGPCQWQVVEYN